MALTFYYGSGSPFAWRVWLALEYKGLPYELRTLSFSAKDALKPEFVRLNPRSRVPVVVDADFALFESAAIVEYLDERFPAGPKLFPGDVQQRALVRRVVHEVDAYVVQAQEALVHEVFMKSDESTWDAKVIEKARRLFSEEMAYFDKLLTRDFLAGPLSAADFALYPVFALVRRFEKKNPELGLLAASGPRLLAWMNRIEALPFYEKTYPPHWR
jgi:glutathione S-transferase